MKKKKNNLFKFSIFTTLICGINLLFFCSFLAFVAWSIWFILVSKRLAFLDYCIDYEARTGETLIINPFFNSAELEDNF